MPLSFDPHRIIAGNDAQQAPRNHRRDDSAGHATPQKRAGNGRRKNCMLRSMKCISRFAKAGFLCNVVGERFM
jgi:hypothetical protein